MPKRLWLFILVLLINNSQVEAQSKPGKPITIVGEVIDTQCYLSGATGPGKGSGHKECALNCAKGGIPLSILEDKTGSVYLAGQTKKAMTTANHMLLDYIAEHVRVRGRLVEKGGVKMVLIDKVEKLPLP
jgi:hypothetical protein